MRTFLALLMSLLVGCNCSGLPFSASSTESSDSVHTRTTEPLTSVVVKAASPIIIDPEEPSELDLKVMEMMRPPPPPPEPWPEPSPAYTLLYTTILGFHPEWRPDACDRPFALESSKIVCERERDIGRAWAGKLAFYIYTEASRQGICSPKNPLCYLWFVGQGQRESGLSRGDICKIHIPVDWVDEVPANAELNSRVRMCWHRGSGGRNCQKVYLRAHNEREYVLDRCAYGEVGVFQVRSHEARMGQIVPATGERLPAPWDARRILLLDPWKNISLAFEAFSVVRDYCCGEGEESDFVCRSHTDFWLGAYNTGKCRGSKTVRYVDKIGRGLVKAMKYVCTVFPPGSIDGFDACNRAEVSSYFTPPGLPRRHRNGR